MKSVTHPALRYHGGKFRLASWVMQFFPPHLVYTEGFGGAAGVLLQKPRSYAEVYNDLDREVANFFRILRDPVQRSALIEAVTMTPYSRDEFDQAWIAADDPVESARRLAVRAMMGFGSAGATKGSTGFRIDTRRRHGTASMVWAKYPEAIAAAGQRFEGVLVENRPAIEVLLQHDGIDTLHFVDPPYVHSTRVRPRSGGYRHEMTDQNHEELLSTLRGLSGMVVLSGYESDLYGGQLTGWEKHTTTSRISAGRGTAIRQEVVWLNPACSQALEGRAGGLFAEACA